MKKAIVSLSGGLDSTCLLMKLINQEEIYNEYFCYSFNYGQKHDIELKKVKKNIKFLQALGYNVNHQEIDLRDCFSDSVSSLAKGSGAEIPEGHYADENMKSTVIENRNVIFSAIIYGKALSVSKRFDCDVDIALGIHAGDHTIYPDTTVESLEACQTAFKISNWGSERVRYIAPFVRVDKSEVLAEGICAMTELGFSKGDIKKVLKNTHTCYNPNEEGESCGKCGSCTERLESFGTVGMKDPIPYQE